MKQKKTLISLSCIFSITIQLISPVFAATYSVDDYDGAGTAIPEKIEGDILEAEEVNAITGVLRGIEHDDGGTAWDNVVEGTTDDTLNVKYDVTSTGTICDSNACIADSQWDDISSPTGIEYTGGDVGIGLENGDKPLGKLHLHKGVSSKPPLVVSKGSYSWNPYTSSYDVVVGDGNDYWGIDAGTDFGIGNSSNNDLLYITSGGNVGIGTTSPVAKLDVNGGIKFGDDTDVCDTTKAGTTRYNSIENYLELCNGTSWEEIGVGNANSENSDAVFMTCTNEQSDSDGIDDVVGCVEAATIGVSQYTIGTSNYIQISCTINSGTSRVTGKGGKFLSGVWQKYDGSNWVNCDDGSMIVMNLNAMGGSSGGSSGTVYTSPEQTITTAGSLTLAHGLGAEPKFTQVYLVNKVAEGGYVVGDKTVIHAQQRVTSGSADGYSLSFDDTNIDIRIGDIGLRLVDKTTGGEFTITNANWKLVVVASTGIGGGSGTTLPTCTDGQILTYNETGSVWECADRAGTSSFIGSGTVSPCKQILDAGDSSGDGVYSFDPDGSGTEVAYDVYCDMTTDGGGWTFLAHVNSNTNSNDFFVTPTGTYQTSRIDNGTLYSLGKLDEWADTEMYTTLDTADVSTADGNNKLIYYRHTPTNTSFNSGPTPCSGSEDFEYKLSTGDIYASGGYFSACNGRWYPKDSADRQLVYYITSNSNYGTYWGAGLGGDNSWYHDSWIYVR